MIRRLIFLWVSVIASIGGCTLSPKYTRPEAPIPSGWPTGAAYQETAAMSGAPAATEIQWRAFLRDERLQYVMEMALDNNRDLRVAALNVQRARAIYGIQRAELLPSINAIGSGIKQRVPGDLSSTGKKKIAEEYSVNLGISSWEIDFFGRIRSLKERALEEYLATEQARRSSRIALIASPQFTPSPRAFDRSIPRNSRRA